MRELNLPVTTHGRVLIDDEPFDSTRPLQLLVGFHGYAQNAGEMMEMLRGIPAGEGWTRVSIQALHRFYRARSLRLPPPRDGAGRSGQAQVTVASWMTREDRALMIDDNVAYIDAAIAGVAAGRAIERLVLFGFSQGVAMAFRAGVRGARRADLVLALGGDVPPELLSDAGLAFPPVLLGRGTRDEWYTAAKLEADEAALEARGDAVETLTFDGAHEWHGDFAARAAAMLAPRRWTRIGAGPRA